jgi:LysR family transcriptional regulator, mexEF-oprN operon transcriptional activator
MTAINHFNLKSFDLNLLLAFDALIQDGSVTRAAKRLKVRQPAMSHSLATLRILLQDELFIREGRTLKPTARALSLAEPVRRVLEQAEAALSFRDTFCPLTETRLFRIGITPDLEATLMPEILTRVRRETPGIHLQSKIKGNVDLLAALDDGSIDVGVSYIDKTAPWHKTEELYREYHVCCYNPKLLPIQLDRRTYLKTPHALLSKTESLLGCLEDILQIAQVELNVVTSSPNFWTILSTVSRTPMLTTLPSKVAIRYAPLFGLKVCDTPVKLGSFPCSMVSPLRTDRESGMEWLQGQLRTAAQRS